jgi:hypothetical protein
LTPLPLGLGVLLADFGARATPLLPLGGLPAMQFLQTLRLPAVPLVPLPRHEVMRNSPCDDTAAEEIEKDLPRGYRSR